MTGHVRCSSCGEGAQWLITLPYGHVSHAGRIRLPASCSACGADLLWVGEYQVTVVGGVWSNWTRFASSLAETVPDTYEVDEVRSRL